MRPSGLSEAIQDYLKGIYKLQQAGGHATVTALARDQGVSAASASAMIKKLAVPDLLEHEPYHGARLTPAGEPVAVEVIRHHRLSDSTAQRRSDSASTMSTTRPTDSST